VSTESGTEGSNPALSSEESGANPALLRALPRHGTDPRITLARVLGCRRPERNQAFSGLACLDLLNSDRAHAKPLSEDAASDAHQSGNSRPPRISIDVIPDIADARAHRPAHHVIGRIGGQKRLELRLVRRFFAQPRRLCLGL
jgi:hypothetical protein